MNRVFTLCLVSLCGVLAFGQHHGGFGSGAGSAGGRYRGVVSAGGAGRHRVFRSPGFYPYALTGGYDWGGYDTGGYDYEPGVMPLQPPAPQVIVQAPPREVRPEIHEYMAPGPASATEPGEVASFVIALADGSLRSANAVWVQSGLLHYVDGDDNHHAIPLSAVDRQSTRKLNRERKLDLWLPAA